MRHKKLKLSAVLLLGLGLLGLQAQESVNTTGGNALGSGGSVSYTVGQVFYSVHTNGEGAVNQGVQHPYEILDVTGIDDLLGITLSVVAYPNPVSDYLVLQVDDFEKNDLRYQLLDMNGRLLQNAKITSSQTHIVMGNLSPAIYFVKVILGNKEAKTFKIVKR